MIQRETVINPELFNNAYVVGSVLYRTLEAQGQELLAAVQPQTEKITVGIRTLNEARTLPNLLDTIEAQYKGADTQVIIVDNESSDGTVDIARSYGAEIVTLPRDEFTYARSMNACMIAADNPLVFLTVGHAALASNVALEASKREFVDPLVAGVFAPYLPSANASRTEKLVGIGNIAVSRKRVEILKAGMGVMGATNATLRKDVWELLGGFDEKYQNGGEDTQLAVKILEEGLKIIRNPLVAVHHSHSTGPINYIRQVHAWTKMLNGDTRPFDREVLQRRRPDLDFS